MLGSRHGPPSNLPKTSGGMTSAAYGAVTLLPFRDTGFCHDDECLGHLLGEQSTYQPTFLNFPTETNSFPPQSHRLIGIMASTSTANTNAASSCIVCDKPNANFCDRCKSSRYCSKECQIAGWPTHKLLCATFSSFVMPARPSKDHVRAILFSPEEKKPKLVWLFYPWVRSY
ncbi:hypothetical protein EJ08DRAFT_682308, partial [Tothia fuscella]